MSLARYIKSLLDHKHDLRDGRDRPFVGVSPTIPQYGNVASPLQRIKDQMQTSSCVGQAVSYAVRFGFLRMGLACDELSARWAYRAARNVDGTPGDDGSFLRSGVRAAQKVGVGREADFPFSEAEINAPLTLSGANGAFDRRGARAYYRITNGATGIRQAIADGYPVVAGTDVDDAFMNWDGSRPIDAPAGNILGGHALCIAIYLPDGTAMGPNSWSETSWGIAPKGADLAPLPGWPRGGYGWYSEAWLNDLVDVWAVDLEQRP